MKFSQVLDLILRNGNISLIPLRELTERECSAKTAPEGQRVLGDSLFGKK